ncbi:MAG TPA: efflux RND transporter periplasmic adaptor subunit, partial [Patescibacteria group bacterium]|nr:efflux RND transporter periplasmic adaptor subunit [Patescibacteria group bacterium]
VEDIYVEVGDSVTKGQKIAKIDKGTLVAQLNQAKADVAAQKQTLASMKRGEYNIESENAQRQVINKYEASISSIQEQLGELNIYSPIDGTVVAKNYEIGENAVANDAIVTVSGQDGIEIEADVPESDIIKVALGRKADLEFDAFTSADIFPATVTKIDPAATVVQDVVYYKVKLKLDRDEPRLKEGMSSDIDIKTAERNNVVFAPMRAVKTENGMKYVEILTDEKKGITERKTVTTGLEGDDGLVEIRSGLSGGEKVVTLTKST